MPRCARTGWTILGVCLAGCYSLQPVRGVEPQVGTQVAFDVNDAGRVALGGTMGPEIAQVEGRLLEKAPGGYLLSVTAIRLLRGGEQVWAGEQIRLREDHLGPAYERRFSTGRTIAFTAVSLGGLAALLTSVSLIAGGTEDNNPPECNPEIEDCEKQDRIGRP